MRDLFGGLLPGVVASVLLLGLAFLAPARAADAAPAAIGEGQRQQIEQIVREYLLAHPEVMIESLRKYEEKRRSMAEKEAKGLLASHREALERDPATPFAGNPRGDVTIVEFFDYNCGYCKKVTPAVQELLRSDGKLRYVFKELPILRPDSTLAAQAALAVWKVAPDKYLPYHLALMEMRGEYTEARLLEAARKLDLDADRVKAAMGEPAVREALKRNLELARTLQVNGTPAFIIGGQLIPGAIDLDTMRELVAAARAG